jgi:uncharacterized protein DUF6717
LTENEYFLRLEGRISGEMAGMRDPSLRHYWCDGLRPDQFAVSGDKCRITGLAYFGESGQEFWSFVVLLGGQTIRDADKGFLLVFSADQFPGAEMELTWLRQEMGGNVYLWEGQEAWLCPALFKYFETAPPRIFAQIRESGR